MEFILPVVGIEAIGDWSFTKFVQGHRKQPLFRIIGYVCYIAVLELFQKAIEFKGLSWANTAWDGWSNIATGAVAVLIFGERPSAHEWIGIILISLGIFFLGREGIASYGDGK
jgi:multidrug transporter EmrE-like cation transporter